MEIVFDQIALKDIQIWKKSGNVTAQKTIVFVSYIFHTKRIPTLKYKL